MMRSIATLATATVVSAVHLKSELAAKNDFHDRQDAAVLDENIKLSFDDFGSKQAVDDGYVWLWNYHDTLEESGAIEETFTKHHNNPDQGLYEDELAPVLTDLAG